MAIYMPGGHEGDLALQLMSAGMPAETPCFVVASASRPDEQVVETTLGEMPMLPTLPAPALVLIGVSPAEPPVQASVKKTGKHAEDH